MRTLLGLFLVSLVACGDSGMFAFGDVRVGIDGDVTIVTGSEQDCGVVISHDDRDGMIPMQDIALKYQLIGPAADPGPKAMADFSVAAWDAAQEGDYPRLRTLARDVTSAICY